MPKLKKKIRKRLAAGMVIPAHPLALDRNRKLDERRQKALTRYYLAAGAGGVAVGVHTTQFEIRKVGLLEPVLQLAAETVGEYERARKKERLLVAGVCGRTLQAVREAQLASDLGYDLALLSLGAMSRSSVPKLLEHVREVGQVMPIFGFYLQPSVGGRVLPYEFWREMAEIESVAAIKIAPFNRYQTFDVMRAVAESSRAEKIALYTGNDDNIIGDLTTPYRFGKADLRMSGGLLGHWAVWTRRAIEHWRECRRVVEKALPIPTDLQRLGNQITDSNAAFFDPQHDFKGCIAGLHEVLRRQGLLEGTWCLNPDEGLSRGQSAEIDRVYAAYPHLNDDLFVAQNIDQWLR